MKLSKKKIKGKISSEEVEIEEIYIENLEYADKKFYDPIKDANGLKTMRSHQEEIDRKIKELERQEAEEIAKLNAEAAAKIKLLEEELARAEAAVAKEIRKIEEIAKLNADEKETTDPKSEAN